VYTCRLHVYIHLYLYIYAYTYSYIYTHISIYIHIHISVHMYIFGCGSRGTRYWYGTSRKMARMSPSLLILPCPPLRSVAQLSLLCLFCLACQSVVIIYRCCVLLYRPHRHYQHVCESLEQESERNAREMGVSDRCVVC